MSASRKGSKLRCSGPWATCPPQRGAMAWTDQEVCVVDAHVGNATHESLVVQVLDAGADCRARAAAPGLDRAPMPTAAHTSLSLKPLTTLQKQSLALSMYLPEVGV
eukprot:9448930-Pyramimonas_sp.AAC.1